VDQSSSRLARTVQKLLLRDVRTAITKGWATDPAHGAGLASRRVRWLQGGRAVSAGIVLGAHHHSWIARHLRAGPAFQWRWERPVPSWRLWTRRGLLIRGPPARPPKR